MAKIYFNAGLFLSTEQREAVKENVGNIVIHKDTAKSDNYIVSNNPYDLNVIQELFPKAYWEQPQMPGDRQGGRYEGQYEPEEIEPLDARDYLEGYLEF